MEHAEAGVDGVGWPLLLSMAHARSQDGGNAPCAKSV